MNKSEPNDNSTLTMQISNLKHGGNVYSNAKKLNLLPSEIIDASASLVPFDPPQIIIDSLNSGIKNLGFRYYPERNFSDLKEIIGKFHGINPDNILPGNGASELITWAGYEASKFGISCIPSPSFIDYERSLSCWNSNFVHCELPKNWGNVFPQPFPLYPKGDVIWITNPHNPTGQLWGKNSLEAILKKYKLVICDEAFLSITPNGEKESLIPLTKKYDNLLVLKSLTKLFNIPGLRLGYIIGSSKKQGNGKSIEILSRALARDSVFWAILLWAGLSNKPNEDKGFLYSIWQPFKAEYIADKKKISKSQKKIIQNKEPKFLSDETKEGWLIDQKNIWCKRFYLEKNPNADLKQYVVEQTGKLLPNQPPEITKELKLKIKEAKSDWKYYLNNGWLPTDKKWD